MKLLLILSVIACSYADKLDRTYLPPASAGTAGGSPGALIAPESLVGLNLPKEISFGQKSPSLLGQSSGSSKFGSDPNRQAGSQIGSLSGLTGFDQHSTQYGTPSGTEPDSVQGLPGLRPSTSYDRPTSKYGAPEAGSGIQGPTELGQPLSQQDFPSGPVSVLGLSGFGSSTASVKPTSQYDAPTAGSGIQGNTGFGQTTLATSPYSGQPQPERSRASLDRNAEILKFDNQNDGRTYSYSYETSNGISAEESGVATNGVQAQGGYSYTGDDGKQYSVRYTADENGYQPQGEHLPTPHPIPEEILRSIEDNARAAAAGTQEGAYNPDENSTPVTQQNYGNANQVQSQPGANTYNQPDTQYGSPNAGVTGSSRPQGTQDPTQYGAPASGSSGVQGFSSQRGQSSGNQNGTPISSGPIKSSGQDQGPTALYGAPAISSGPQGSSFQRGQSPSPQYGTPAASGPQGSSFQRGQSPSPQYGTPAASGPQGSPFQRGQSLSPQYGTPAASGPQGSSFQRGQSPSPQYGTPATSGPQGSSFQRGQSPSSQYGTPAASGPQSFSSQRGQSPVSQYGAPAAPGPIGSVKSQGQPSQNGQSVVLSGSQGFPSQGFPSQRGQSPTSQFSAQVRPITQGGDSGYQYKAPSGFPSGPQGSLQSNQYGASTPAASSAGSQDFPSQATQSPTFPNSPTGTFGPQGGKAPSNLYTPPTSSGSDRPGFPSSSQSPASQYGASNGQSGLQVNQVPENQYGFPTSKLGSNSQSGPQESQSPSTQYGPPTSSQTGVSKLSRPQDFPSAANQVSPFNGGGPSRPNGARPVTQSHDDGYQYNKPQTQFGRPSQERFGQQPITPGPAFLRPTGQGFSSSTPVGTPAPTSQIPSFGKDPASGFRPSGSLFGPSGTGSISGSTLAPQGSGFSKPTASANQGYPKGPAGSLSGNGPIGSAPGSINLGSQFSRPTGSVGQFSPSRPISSSVSPGGFGRRTSSTRPILGSKVPSFEAQPTGSTSFMSKSGYEYNRPVSQGTQSGISQGQNSPQFGFGLAQPTFDQNDPQSSLSPAQNRPQYGFGPIQNQPSQNIPESGFGPAQKSPGQNGPQSSFGPSRLERPSENFDGPRQPPSFSPEDGYKY